MALIDRALERELGQLHENGVQLRHLGSLRRLNPATRKRVLEAMDLTRQNRRLILNIAFNYGGRAEITHAVRSMVEEGLQPEEITEDCLAAHLYTAGQPDPDLIIRTGGEMRLSNFLLWQCAYTEFYATEIFWPDFDAQAFQAALQIYRNRHRRYGGLEGDSQVRVQI
jgi:undecaprenyl diphosphate synthase